MFVNASICPLIFIAVEYPLTTPSPMPTIMVEYGNYFICGGVQFPPPYSIPDYDLDIYFPFCNQQVAIFVQSKCPVKTSKWISWECERLGRLNCFVRQLNGVYYSIRIAPVNDTNTTTTSPTLTPTVIPTQQPIVRNCDEITDQTECNEDGCNWFGTLIKCQRKTYCEGLTMIPCLTRKMFCMWKGNKCKEK